MRQIVVGLGFMIAGCSAVPGATSEMDAGRDFMRQPALVTDAAVTTTGPLSLSDTGLYSDFASRTLAPRIIPFAPKYPFWADGAEKNRFLLLPAGSQINTSNMDFWSFPIGTKVWKEFRVGGKLVETRLLWKQLDSGPSGWWMVSYVWAPDGSAATATPGGVSNALGTTHDVPSQQDCLKCHGNAGDVVIGVSAIQLSATVAATGVDAGADAGGADGGVATGTLTLLGAMGLLTVAPASEFQVPGSGNVQAALGYLHGNCGHCHNDESALSLQSAMRLRLSTTNTAPEQTPTYKTAFGLKTRHVVPPNVDTAIVPGFPDKSQLYVRADRRDSWGMPPLGTKVVDPVGSVQIYDWILNLPH